MLYLLLTLIVAISTHKCYASEGCQAPIILAKDMPPSVELPYVPPHHRSKRATITKLRIHLDYQSSFDSLSGSSFIKTNIVEVAKAKIEAAVKAKNPLSSALLVDRNCENGLYRRNSEGTIGCATGCVSQTTCLSVPVPDKYLKECTTISSTGSVFKSGSSGVGISDTDLVILVTAESCSSNSTIAYANGCFLEKSLDRPILGVVNLCASHFSANADVIENIGVIEHEMIHVLGFTVDKFAYYRFRNGNPRVKRSVFNFPDNGLNSIGNQPLDPFCNSVLEVGNKLKCYTSKKYYEICNLRQFTSVSLTYRYFTNSLLAGGNVYNEYCPVYASATNPSFNCEDSLNNGKSSNFFAFSNYFGSDSKCFETDSSSNNTYYGAACMKHQCDMGASRYSVTYNSTTYQCTGSNEHILSGSGDKLKCASFASVCQYTAPTKKTFVTIPDTDSGLMAKCNCSFIIISLLVWFISGMY